MALDPIVTFPQRQYVGARYVPIYKGAWDPQTSYEPLSIVVKDGNSWTSKIFVPAGIELSNETYWFQSGNVNGQTIELQKQITELEKSVENSIDNINNEIENVNNRLDNLIIKRNIIFITDSYGVSSSEGTPFTTAAKTMLANDKTIADITVSATGSSGFTQAGSLSWTTITQNLAAGMSDTEREKVTDIYLLGGANDQANNTAVTNSINAYFAAIRPVFKNANFHIAACTKSYSSTLAAATRLVYNSYKSGALANGADFLEGLSNVMCWREYLQSDKVHPNAQGQGVLAYALVQSVLGREYAAFNNQTTKVYFQPGRGDVAVQFYTERNGNIATIGTQFLCDAAITLAEGTNTSTVNNRLALPGLFISLQGQATLPTEDGEVSVKWVLSGDTMTINSPREVTLKVMNEYSGYIWQTHPTVFL